MKELNISLGYDNHSQRNNEVDPQNACGPTNFIQALKYAGWEWDKSMLPQFTQDEDKLMYFTRTNKDVLDYYATRYAPMYKNWWNESHTIAKAQNKEYWQVACPNTNPPNEVHDVMSYAVNLFVGYTAEDLSKMEKRPVTRFYNEKSEFEIIWALAKGLPVVSSVDPFKNNGGHYITIVGLSAENDFELPKNYNDKSNFHPEKISDYIIDNTYGKFDFVNKRYIKVSGNDEHIERKKFLYIMKPVAHYFTKGAAVCC